MISNLLTKLFGTKSSRDIKQILPYVGRINAEFDKMKAWTDNQLRASTDEVRDMIDARLKDIDDKIAALHQTIDDDPDLDINKKEDIFNEIDKLEEDRNTKLEEVLMEVLPKGFAIVKETARRFLEQGKLEVEATMYDKQMAAGHENVRIVGEKAIWDSEWTAAGHKIKWDMLHYDVQLIGGIVLHQGKISEMATGEGKTLVATLPAYLNALARRGVHIVTVNDYLARRDSEWMAPLFQFHGLKIDCIDKHEPNSEARRQAYKSDIIYGTNNEFGFDYLRDNMTREVEELVQRKHHFAMVDEVDSVLIDDARTPLIISGPVPRGDEHQFHEMKPRVEKLVEAQKKIVSQFLIEAKKLIKDGSKEGGAPLFRAFRGLPKYKPLIKFLSETGVKHILQKTENYYLQDNSKMMPEADEPLYFTIDEKNNAIELTDKGHDLITGVGEDKSFFILPDIGSVIAKLENDTDLTEQERLKKKEDLIREYSEKSDRIHTVNQLLKAYTLFEKDTEYILVNGKVKIVDEQTGRVLEGRRYSDGLHQAIEAKENVKVEDATQTYATITLQNYFRMYHKLAGMTGTAETEAGEFWDIYKLDVVVIPTNRPIVRDDREDLVYKTIREKFNAVVEEIVSLSKQGRPVLVGTTSVEISEILSRMLHIRKIEHQVLNAKQHAKEADVVAHAGESGTVTIATNMAGRGTDIKLTPESKAAGGLAIVGTERHESRRVDRQLRGRSGRQGDPGSSQFFVSLEDNLMRLFGSDRIAKLMDRMGLKEGEVIQHSMITKSIERAQKKVEENNFAIRKRLLEYDDVMNSQREVIYKRRKNALFGERLQLDILNMLYDIAEDVATGAKDANDFDGLMLNVISTLGLDFKLTKDEFETMQVDELINKLYRDTLENYNLKNTEISTRAFPIFLDIQKTKGANITDVLVPFTDGIRQIQVSTNLEKNIQTECKELILSLEKISTLSIIDTNWKDHLREMDDLKQSVQSAVYEQKDPLLIYKFEAFELFKKLIAKVNQESVSFLTKADLPVQEPEQVQEARRQRRQQRYNESKEESKSLLESSNAGAGPRPPVENPVPRKSRKVAGRNERVSVQYQDGTIKKGVKFKTIEDDVLNNRCVIIEND